MNQWIIVALIGMAILLGYIGLMINKIHDDISKIKKLIITTMSNSINNVKNP